MRSPNLDAARALVVLVVLFAGVGAPAAPQETITADRARVTERAVIGGATMPTSGVLRLIGVPARTAGQNILSVNGSGDVTAGVLAKADLPAPIAYEDEANVFSVIQTITGTAPALTFLETGGNANRQRYALVGDADRLSLQTLTDAGVITATPWAAEHGGSLVFNPTSQQVLPSAPYALNLGSPIQRLLGIYAAELNVETIVAQDTMATVGGRIIVAPTTYLIADVTPAATTIATKHNNLASGDRVLLEANGRFEVMAVTNGGSVINRCTSNCSIETGTTGYLTDGTVTLASSNESRWQGGKALKWTWSAGIANVYRNTGGELAASTTFTASIYVRRADGAAVVPSASAYQMYLDSTLATITPTAIDVGEGWYRLTGTRTIGGSLGNSIVGLNLIPTGTVHYFDAWQIEVAAAATPWSEFSRVYTVTRDLDGSGANDWDAGTALVNTGTTGQGFLDLYSTRGVRSATEIGPTIVGNVRLSPTYNDWAPRWAIGNLQGLYGYGSTTFGAAFGDSTAANVTIDAANGVRIRHGATNKLHADAAGNLSLVSGNVTINNDGIRIAPTTADATSRAYIWDSALAGRFLEPGAYFHEQGGGASDASILTLLNIGTNTAIHAVNLRSGSAVAEAAVGAQAGSGAANTITSLNATHYGPPGFATSLLLNGSGLEATANPFTGGAAIGRFAFAQALQIRFDNSSTNPGVPWIRSDGNFLVMNGDGPMYLNLDNPSQNLFLSATQTYAINLAPSNPNVYDLGNTTYRWRYVHAGTGIGVGLAGTPAYQIQLGADSAGKPTSATWTIVSDRRSKRNVTPLVSHLAKIRALELVGYEYTGAFGTPTGAPGIGAVADDVRPLFPRAVRTVGTGADAYLALDWHDIWVGNVKATQELAAEVDRLSADVAALLQRGRDPVSLTQRAIP